MSPMNFWIASKSSPNMWLPSTASAGEVYGEEDVKERQPSAWNVEAGMQITEDIGIGPALWRCR
jgi:hypothetical protein